MIKTHPKPSVLPLFGKQHKLLSCHVKKCQDKIPDQSCAS